MLAGAWGAPAGELLERQGAQVHRFGELSMLAAPDVREGRWCAWLWGAPRTRAGCDEDAATLLARTLAARGLDAAEQLCGRFVLVLLDTERGACAVLRDQLGAQPLVYRRLVAGALFAEHERDLLALASVTPRPERLALLQWIDNGTIPSGRTLYEQLSRLAPGHRLSLRGDGCEVERWWRLPYRGVDEGSRTELAERLRAAGFAAVERAAAGAERPAVKLSGGLDSACVAAALGAVAGGRARALGGTFPEHPASDERQLIEATAGHTGLPLELIESSGAGSMLEPALEHIERWRLPPATPNLFLWRPLMARARELGVDVMLDGEGGDELFGLTPYLIADAVRAGRLWESWSLTGRMPGIEHTIGSRLGELRRYGLAPLQPSGLSRRRAERRLRRNAASSLLAPADELALIGLRVERERDSWEGPIWWRSLAKSLIEMRDLLDMGGHYRRLDAEEGVERRHPLLHDLELIEVVLRIPPRAQFDRSRDRPLLRDGLAGRIPHVVLARTVKSHFTPLVLEGLRNDEAGLVDPLRAPDAPIRAYVVAQALDRRLAVEPGSRPLPMAASLWRLGIANRWLLALEGDRR